MRALRSVRSAARRGGFTLIEIVAAMLLFFLVVTFAMWAMSDCVDQSLAAERARQLRMLAELKLGEIAVFERHFDEQYDAREFDDLPEEMRETYREWEWSTEVTDKTVFGPVKDENAPALFDTGESETNEDGGTKTEDATQAAKKGDQVILRELVLKISAPGDDEGGHGSSIEIVTYLPQVPAKSAAAPKTGEQK